MTTAGGCSRCGQTQCQGFHVGGPAHPWSEPRRGHGLTEVTAVPTGREQAPDHLDGCCLLDPHVVPLDCETPNYDRLPITGREPSPDDEPRFAPADAIASVDGGGPQGREQAAPCAHLGDGPCEDCTCRCRACAEGREQAGYWHQGKPLVGDDSEPHPLDADGVQSGRKHRRRTRSSIGCYTCGYETPEFREFTIPKLFMRWHRLWCRPASAREQTPRNTTGADA